MDKGSGSHLRVNLDADEGQVDKQSGLPLPDSVNVNDEGIPDYDDQTLWSDDDVEDLTPLVLRGVGAKGAKLPKDVSVYLKAENLDEVQAIHVFPRIKSPADAILGGVGSRYPGSPPMPLEVDVTSLLGPGNPDREPNGDVTLGLEGLFFRNVGPPTPEHPLGLVVVGSSRGSSLAAFLASQELQTVQGKILEVPSKWLRVGHLDEMFAFLSTIGTVAQADPDLAYEVLEESRTGLGGKAVLFAIGALPVIGKVLNVSDTGLQLEFDANQEVAPHRWRYLRIYAGSGAGQIGRVAEGGFELTSAGTLRTAAVSVDKVWQMGRSITPSYAFSAKAPQWPTEGGLGQDPVHWDPFARPTPGDKVVLVEDTRMWDLGNPAFITVEEVLRDKGLRLLNTGLSDASEAPAARRTSVRTEIDKGREMLQAQGGMTRFVGVPVLFIGDMDPDAFADGRSAGALTPNLANAQFAGGFVFMPRQFGPRGGTWVPGSQGDALEAYVIQRSLGGDLPPIQFVDDWNGYHRHRGEVHCGTTVVREPMAIEWWRALR